MNAHAVISVDKDGKLVRVAKEVGFCIMSPSRQSVYTEDGFWIALDDPKYDTTKKMAFRGDVSALVKAVEVGGLVCPLIEVKEY